MKLTKKLIPLTGILGLTAIVTPLSFTSCDAGVSLEDLKKMVDPQIEKFSGDIENSVDATKAYKRFIEHNPEEFIKDIKWGVRQNWDSFFDWSNHTYTPTGEPGTPTQKRKFQSQPYELHFGMSKPKIGSVNICAPATPPEIYGVDVPTISFKMKTVVKAKVFSIIASEDTDISENYTEHNVTFSCEAEYKDVPFFAYLSSRNDKTNGASGSPASYFKQTWFITTCQDNDAQELHSLNQQAWSIDYSAKLDDEIYDVVEGKRPDQPSLRSGNVTSHIDTAAKLQVLNRFKDYSWNNYDDPGQGWEAWFEQQPEAYVANAVLLDNATEYFDAEDTKQQGDAYVENSRFGLSLSNILPTEYQAFNTVMGSVSFQLPANYRNAQILDVQVAPGYWNTSGQQPKFTAFSDEDLQQIRFTESTAKLEDSQRHYHTQDTSSIPTPIEFQFAKGPCLPYTPISNPAIAEPIVAKQNYNLPITIYNIDAYELDNGSGMQQKWVSDSLTFSIPQQVKLNSTGENVRLVLEFLLHIKDDSGEGTLSLDLDFSEPSTNRDVTFSIPTKD